MKLITLNVDESIIEELMEALKKYPEEKLTINDEPVLEITMDEIAEITDEEDEIEDYFMIDEEDNIMPFEVEIEKDPDYDEEGTAEVHIYFENGAHYFGFFETLNEVQESIDDEDYYFSGFVIVKTLDHNTIKNSIIEMIERRDFFEAFDDMEDYDDDDDDLELDDIDPIRRN